MLPQSRLMSPKLLPWAPQARHFELHLAAWTSKNHQKLEGFDVFKMCAKLVLNAFWMLFLATWSSIWVPHGAHRAKRAPKSLHFGTLLQTFFGPVLSWMLDRAEKVPKGSQKTILASVGKHFDTFLIYFRLLGCVSTSTKSFPNGCLDALLHNIKAYTNSNKLS